MLKYIFQNYYACIETTIFHKLVSSSILALPILMHFFFLEGLDFSGMIIYKDYVLHALCSMCRVLRDYIRMHSVTLVHIDEGLMLFERLPYTRT